MSVSVTVAGSSYTIPQVGEVTWGANVTAWIQAISSATLQTSGGSFVLTGDLSFGTNFGLISKYFTSLTANAASTGVLRLANSDGIGWRNSGNSADFLLKPDADGILQYNGIDLVNLSAAQTLLNKTIAAGSNTITGLANANLSGSAGITNANLAAMAAGTVKANVTGGSAVPTDVALVAAPTASTAMFRDSNANVAVNGIIEGFATIATAAGTTTLTVASAMNQQFTGSTTQTVVLPDATTLRLGQQFFVANRSTGTVTVNANGGGLVQSLTTNVAAMLTCTSIGSAAGAWDVSLIANSVLANPMTTKGDVISNAGGGSPARVAVGSNGFFLGADSTAANGLSWQNPINWQNQLINGALDWWQAGTSSTVTATGGATPTATYLYQADQWSANNILGGGTVEGIITYSQVTGATNGSKFGAKLQITTAPTGTGIQNGCELYQALSNRATMALYGQTASFTVLVKSFGNVNQVGVQFFYATSEGKLTTSIGSEVLTTVNTSTFTSCTINGQALGTSMTTSGIVGVRIRITAVSSGNTYDLNNGFVIEQAMLNLGPVAMPFSRQYNDPAQELMACKYFYEVLGGSVAHEQFGAMYSGSTTTALGVFNYATKRAAPSITFSNAAKFRYNNAANNFTSSAMSAGGIGVSSAQATLTTSGIAASNLPGTFDSFDATGTIAIDARM